MTCSGGLLDCSAEGFAKAMDISCHSFVRMARLAAPLMTDGGTMFAMSYLRRQPRRAELQRHGPGQGRPGSGLPLPRLRARPPAHPRSRHLARAAQDARRLRPEGLRAAAERGGARRRRSASWSTSWTWAGPAPISPRRSPIASPAAPSMSTAAATSSPDTGHDRPAASLSSTPAPRASSSRVYEAGAEGALLFRGQVENIGAGAAPDARAMPRARWWRNGPGRRAGSTIAARPARS